MNIRHFDQAKKLVAQFTIPDPVKKSMQADLQDAICKGFLIDFEQLSANLASMSQRSAG